MSLAGHLAHGGPAQPGSIEAISGRHVGCKYVCILVEGSLTVFAVATPSFFVCVNSQQAALMLSYHFGYRWCVVIWGIWGI